MMLAAAVLPGLLPVRGADVAPIDDPTNFAFARYLGSGFYSLNGRNALVITVKPSIGLRSEEENPFGVRLRLGLSLGYFDLKPEDVSGLGIDEQSTVGSFTLGVGFPIRVTGNWLLEPFIDLGAGYSSDAETYGLGDVGARSRAVFVTQPVDYVLVNRLVYAEATASGVFAEETFKQLKTELDIRRLVTHSLGKRSFDLAFYARNDYYPGGIEVIGGTIDSRIDLTIRWQLGFTWGTQERWDVWWKLKAPRIGLAHVFGDGADGIRFIFRFRE